MLVIRFTFHILAENPRRDVDVVFADISIPLHVHFVVGVLGLNYG